MAEAGAPTKAHAVERCREAAFGAALARHTGFPLNPIVPPYLQKPPSTCSRPAPAHVPLTTSPAHTWERPCSQSPSPAGHSRTPGAALHSPTTHTWALLPGCSASVPWVGAAYSRHATDIQSLTAAAPSGHIPMHAPGFVLLMVPPVLNLRQRTALPV
jgi:hypothetical protein